MKGCSWADGGAKRTSTVTREACALSDLRTDHQKRISVAMKQYWERRKAQERVLWEFANRRSEYDL